jgi:two-component system, OmpR family, phosphate regulon response regulator PhoB
VTTVVLLVEDEVDVAELLRDVFEQEGFAAAIALNGLDALQLLGSIQPAIIVSDVEMPGMSGTEFCSAVREHPTYTDIPIIATSALEEEVVREKFDCYDAFIPKPYDVDHLIELIKKLLSDQVEGGGRPRSSKRYAYGKTALEFLRKPRA